MNRSWVVGKDYEVYRCIDKINFDEISDKPEWRLQTDSPWYKPQDCYWPINADDERLCSMGDSTNGMYECENGKKARKKVNYTCCSRWACRNELDIDSPP